VHRSLSLFDARNRIVFSYLWQLPVPNYQGAKGKILNGWAVSGIDSFQSGFPVRIQSSDDAELMNSFDFELPGKPDLIAPFHTQDPGSTTVTLSTPTLLRSLNRPQIRLHFSFSAMRRGLSAADRNQ